MDIAVIGSNMVDLISYITRMPEEGETIEAPGFALGCGAGPRTKRPHPLVVVPQGCFSERPRTLLDQVPPFVEGAPHVGSHRADCLRNQANNQPRAHTPAARTLARDELEPMAKDGGDVFGITQAVAVHCRGQDAVHVMTVGFGAA